MERFLDDMATNSELAGIYAKGLMSFESLTVTEHVQLSTHFNRIYRSYESMFRQNRAVRV